MRSVYANKENTSNHNSDYSSGSSNSGDSSMIKSGHGVGDDARTASTTVSGDDGGHDDIDEWMDSPGASGSNGGGGGGNSAHLGAIPELSDSDSDGPIILRNVTEQTRSAVAGGAPIRRGSGGGGGVGRGRFQLIPNLGIKKAVAEMKKKGQEIAAARNQNKDGDGLDPNQDIRGPQRRRGSLGFGTPDPVPSRDTSPIPSGRVDMMHSPPPPPPPPPQDDPVQFDPIDDELRQIESGSTHGTQRGMYPNEATNKTQQHSEEQQRMKDNEEDFGHDSNEHVVLGVGKWMDQKTPKSPRPPGAPQRSNSDDASTDASEADASIGADDLLEMIKAERGVGHGGGPDDSGQTADAPPVPQSPVAQSPAAGHAKGMLGGFLNQDIPSDTSNSNLDDKSCGTYGTYGTYGTSMTEVQKQKEAQGRTMERQDSHFTYSTHTELAPDEVEAKERRPWRKQAGLRRGSLSAGAAAAAAAAAAGGGGGLLGDMNDDSDGEELHDSDNMFNLPTGFERGPENFQDAWKDQQQEVKKKQQATPAPPPPPPPPSKTPKIKNKGSRRRSKSPDRLSPTPTPTPAEEPPEKDYSAMFGAMLDKKQPTPVEDTKEEETFVPVADPTKRVSKKRSKRGHGDEPKATPSARNHHKAESESLDVKGSDHSRVESMTSSRRSRKDRSGRNKHDHHHQDDTSHGTNESGKDKKSNRHRSKHAEHDSPGSSEVTEEPQKDVGGRESRGRKKKKRSKTSVIAPEQSEPDIVFEPEPEIKAFASFDDNVFPAAFEEQGPPKRAISLNASIGGGREASRSRSPAGSAATGVTTKMSNTDKDGSGNNMSVLDRLEKQSKMAARTPSSNSNGHGDGWVVSRGANTMMRMNSQRGPNMMGAMKGVHESSRSLGQENGTISLLRRADGRPTMNRTSSSRSPTRPTQAKNKFGFGRGGNKNKPSADSQTESRPRRRMSAPLSVNMEEAGNSSSGFHTPKLFGLGRKKNMQHQELPFDPPTPPSPMDDDDRFGRKPKIVSRSRSDGDDAFARTEGNSGWGAMEFPNIENDRKKTSDNRGRGSDSSQKAHRRSSSRGSTKSRGSIKSRGSTKSDRRKKRSSSVSSAKSDRKDTRTRRSSSVPRSAEKASSKSSKQSRDRRHSGGGSSRPRGDADASLSKSRKSKSKSDSKDSHHHRSSPSKSSRKKIDSTDLDGSGGRRSIGSDSHRKSRKTHRANDESPKKSRRTKKSDRRRMSV